ncbi:hypothetical protein PC129_g19832 [Phytophthora cactorum]|uniref:Uncharacterized protein n=1 Tax=Phytophthora cactorum TaxID=29920 RepID=A0A329RHF0_9STRA|nr:hypothetical protein Pcac1_g16080 [Phytophthora cactorum]KAG2796565.1 hypothetical protein PC111_g21669 [Phytophthora cactorum]KAG2796838.1 hypothetical protein PC112_g22042 [Phytophthora cactorum]KAG2824757.1 hypothetical protein PC113_g21992 [Phytophthora cactorum]KAG2887112.1 hypothetical protein PC115_g20462 [Phytophthora cactorum]
MLLTIPTAASARALAVSTVQLLLVPTDNSETRPQDEASNGKCSIPTQKLFSVCPCAMVTVTPYTIAALAVSFTKI